MDLDILRVANVRRCEKSYHKLSAWTPSDWACAMAGEAGEVCQAVLELSRLLNRTATAKGPQTEQEARENIADELADTIIYADLLAARLGINLSEAIKDKFNKTSIRISSSIIL